MATNGTVKHLQENNALEQFYKTYNCDVNPWFRSWECIAKARAEFNRIIADCTEQYTDGYSEFDEPDCFEMLERVDLDDDNMPLDDSFDASLCIDDETGFYF